MENVKKDEEIKQNNEDVQIEDDMDAALDGFDEEVNVTQDEQDDKNDDCNPELEKEYQQFLNSLNQEEGENGEGMDQLGNLMKNLIKDFGSNNEHQNLDGDGNKFEDIANNLLNEFMDPEILEEPLKEADKNYEDYLKKKKDSLPQEEYKQYENQLNCIKSILQTIKDEPQNKEKMIDGFEKMQDYGSPPDELLKSFGSENPFVMFQKMQQQGGQSGLPGNNEECVIF